MVEFSYDKAGRIQRKTVRDNPVQDSTIKYESDYTYDGMSRLVRERIWRYDGATDMMIVTQDTKTTFDLGGNPTEIKFSDYKGWAYTETRTYAKGYQITNATFSARADITVMATVQSFTYDANGNMLTSKGIDIRYTIGATQLAYRESWTFEFDELNRLKNFTHAGTSNKRWIWYDARDRVWQRWTQNKGTSAWEPALNSFVYDGGALAQEHEVAVVNQGGTWVYTYTDLTRDYLRKPGGIRQIERKMGADDLLK